MKDGSSKKDIVLVRSVVTALLLIFILLTPWWLYTGLIIFFIFYLSPYYEALFLGFFVDALYGPSVLLDFPLLFTSSAVILVLFSKPLRERLTW